jgi:outer membrane protein insertion porin family
VSTQIGKRMWGPRWDGSISYRFSYTQIEDDRNARRLPPILANQEGDRILSSITPRLVYDSRDSGLQPSRGWLMEAGLEIGGIGGDYSWVKPQFDASRYFTMYKLKGGGKHILELRGRAAAIEAYGSTDDVPPFMRFYAGGIDTIRGFQFRTITPRENGFQIGGKRLVVGTAEYSMPLYEEIVRGSVFIDAGSVWDPGETDPRTRVTNESGFRASTGFGLAIRTPLSPMPIRVYVTRPLVKNDEDRTKTLDFTFGTRF